MQAYPEHLRSCGAEESPIYPDVVPWYTNDRSQSIHRRNISHSCQCQEKLRWSSACNLAAGEYALSGKWI